MLAHAHVHTMHDTDYITGRGKDEDSVKKKAAAGPVESVRSRMRVDTLTLKVRGRIYLQRLSQEGSLPSSPWLLVRNNSPKSASLI